MVARSLESSWTSWEHAYDCHAHTDRAAVDDEARSALTSADSRTCDQDTYIRYAFVIGGTLPKSIPSRSSALRVVWGSKRGAPTWLFAWPTTLQTSPRLQQDEHSLLKGARETAGDSRRPAVEPFTRARLASVPCRVQVFGGLRLQHTAQITPRLCQRTRVLAWQWPVARERGRRQAGPPLEHLWRDDDGSAEGDVQGGEGEDSSETFTCLN